MVDVASDIRYYILNEDAAEAPVKPGYEQFSLDESDVLLGLKMLNAYGQATAVLPEDIRVYLDQHYGSTAHVIAGIFITQLGIQEALDSLVEINIVGASYYTEHIDKWVGQKFSFQPPDFKALEEEAKRNAKEAKDMMDNDPVLEAMRQRAIEDAKPKDTPTGLDALSAISTSVSEFIIAGNFTVIDKFDWIGGSRHDAQYMAIVNHALTNTEWTLITWEPLDDSFESAPWIQVISEYIDTLIEWGNDTFNIAASDGVDVSVKINLLRQQGRI